MGFYDLDKKERSALVLQIAANLEDDINSDRRKYHTAYFSDPDTYIRKTAYLSLGKIYLSSAGCRVKILTALNVLHGEQDARIRQTVINAAGEIGKTDFEIVRHFFDKGLFDAHHSVRNAVIGSMKKMGEKNPGPVLEWSRQYLHHPDKEIRREICHGIELRGRTHPGDILPLLIELQHDKTKRVTGTLVHVIGQIAYKKGCLETVLSDLDHWENRSLVSAAVAEIVDVHDRYRNFSFYTQSQALEIIARHGYRQ